MLNLNDVFYTIQGEGFYAGSAALFVRMPFCNLACPWCDTEFNSFTPWSEENFEHKARLHYKEGAIAVITGGEPSMNKHSPAVAKILQDIGYTVTMESNGQFPKPEGVDFLTVSPKRWHNKDSNDLSKKFYFNETNMIGEIKVVVDAEDVFEFLEKLNLKVPFLSFVDGPKLYLSPEWDNRDKWLPRMTEYVMNNPQWKISLQTHKIIGAK